MPRPSSRTGRPSMCTKKSPGGALVSRKFPKPSVTARTLSSRPSAVTTTSASGTFTERFVEPADGVISSEANTRPATIVPASGV